MQPQVKQVLVVDDDRDIRDTLEMVFANEGYHVFKAPDGGVALDLLRRSPTPLPVFLDMMMPRVDGLAVLRQVHAEAALTRHAFTMLTAANGMLPGELLRLLGHLQIKLLGKPFDITAILNELDGMRCKIGAL